MLSPISPFFLRSMAFLTHSATSSSSVPLPAPISFLGMPRPGSGDAGSWSSSSSEMVTGLERLVSQGWASSME